MAQPLHKSIRRMMWSQLPPAHTNLNSWNNHLLIIRAQIHIMPVVPHITHVIQCICVFYKSIILPSLLYCKFLFHFLFHFPRFSLPSNFSISQLKSQLVASTKVFWREKGDSKAYQNICSKCFVLLHMNNININF